MRERADAEGAGRRWPPPVVCRAGAGLMRKQRIPSGQVRAFTVALPDEDVRRRREGRATRGPGGLRTATQIERTARK
ncbi:hypothetical protein GCM10010278_85020 [Streptomyces melanogenes]|nr:hypothetical protein GCM10010278_85020 [Streptomyces melanogenes]